ncbi:threonine/homoserine/homoserine lactone efflux protein [Dyadobacter jejuensis]|uniref:Threonine/homoserine/homoserine lactone efflux protein n=1 Tax=Dyadobacter jejuensis TaxID=1082580 RepID=A0A316ANM4_9BACT|nr:LysE family transporter [Dyadobacter jejuensis]PWJ58909.1 threonine/homoserine/homoserine lactone efflux protein [Dyadobacter jejuensis]
MLESLLYGVLTGVGLCLTFGTVFFSLVQNSVDNGYTAGFKIAFGVFVCDLLFVFFAIFGTSFLPDIPYFQQGMAAVGVLFLGAMGLSNLIGKKPEMAYPKTRFGGFILYFSTGFLLNGLNPINFISWVTIATYIRTALQYTLYQEYAFFGASVVSIFVVECVIAIFSHKLKKWFTPRFLTLFNRLTGVVFVGIALQLAYSSFIS